ncbi:putative cupin superfamily sugar epimerase [Alkalibacillus flavidus]|uniref:Cupin superfamily sugar epimerase n=1 Tax=Alkalibacillus flavidus TaxID=546021 RepID=A0ABV2KTG2_9BACI
MKQSAQTIIDQLGLEPHPEGGFFRGTYQSDLVTDASGAERSLYTSIYFLLRSQDVSHFHRLQSDELWYFHGGSPLYVHTISPGGEYQKHKLGLDLENGETPQLLVPKHTIFGSSVVEADTYSLVGCMVAPGFDFADFELFDEEDLLEQYPEHEDVIKMLTPDE